MLALAHRMQAMIDAGEVEDCASLARRLRFSRARITQLLDLTLLAPDLQLQVLELEAVDGVEPLAERQLRAVMAAGTWPQQRAAWGCRGRGRASSTLVDSGLMLSNNRAPDRV